VIADRKAQRLLQRLRPGTPVQAQVGRQGELLRLEFVTPADALATVESVNGKLQSNERALHLEREIVARSAQIRSNVFAASDQAGVPDAIARQLPQVFGGQLDFNTDLKKGDRFSAVYEMLYFNGQLVHPGRLLAAEVVHAGRAHRAVWFENGSIHGYYAPNGETFESTFLRSPLDFSRLTSGLERRFDSRSQQWVTHKGLDLAAPIGTPVRAVGSGTVQMAGQQSGYGKVVVLRHQGSYSTLYAHLSGFAQGLSTSSRVSKGQIIGYVGQTGWATGPHLHYEFRVDGRFVNPFTIALPGAAPLDARSLVKLREQTAPLLGRLDLLKTTDLAYAE
jgi:murein DD-endopeptidase MepM/ murein hydrolase activator NlpD